MDTDSPSPELPADLVHSIRSTIARALDYICDVISCSPEQLRLPKTEEKIRKDEEDSRLTSRYYGPETDSEDIEYALILWNDEKHTVDDVKSQVSRACKQSMAFGKARAQETDAIGRSIVRYSNDLPELLEKARIIEQIQVTVTIRSSRDTFREQMCGTIIEWLEDISGCSVGGDHNILRTTVCEELLGKWRVGTKASNKDIGQRGIDDHAGSEERRHLENAMATIHVPVFAAIAGEMVVGDGDDDEDDGDDMDVDLDQDDGPEEEDDDAEQDDLGDEDDVDMVESGAEDDQPRAQAEFTIQRLLRGDLFDSPRVPSFEGPTQSIGHASDDPVEGAPRIPVTPFLPPHHGHKDTKSAPSYWKEKQGISRHQLPRHEDLKQRVRLDWLIMFDLRLWKKARVGLRDLYISTVVVIPAFKRILGLRFAGLYPALSELYLVADREPDHSIINLSLQMLTTPSITAEVVRRGNFLTTLFAIVYTFLTTRQVGHPNQLNPEATLAFNGGAQTNPLTNRRMYHFFHDLQYLLVSDYVQERLRVEPKYTLQFLDLVRLHQGICPNSRAVSEHVEYEAEAWVSATMVTREINKLSRQFSEAFRSPDAPTQESLRRVIATAAKYSICNSMGWERRRFKQSEIKTEAAFREIGGYQFDTDRWEKPYNYRVVKYNVDKDPVSFHHALHYTLSWLIEAGKSMSNDQLRQLLLLGWEQLGGQAPPNAKELDPEDFAVVMFDFPLRVCVWLAQVKTGMWVRNGYSLRHLMQTYRSVAQRDLTHQRDIFLLQTSLVTVNPSRMLVSMIDRFNLNQWMMGNYTKPDNYDDTQVLDLAEDFLHLLIVILTDRLPLVPLQDEPDLQVLRLRRELIHILCFKPMVFSELTRHVPERFQNYEKFHDVLGEISNYNAPGGLSDYGTFELKPEYLDEVDPYIVQFTKNQREEMEANFRERMAKKTGKPESEIIFEPRLRRIESGVFRDIGAFTKTAIFAQIIFSSLSYALDFKTATPAIPETRVEIFVQLVLHLCQLAVLEDNSVDGDDEPSFVLYALEKEAPSNDGTGNRTIATVLYLLSNTDDFKACWSKILYVLRSFKQKRPALFNRVASWATGLNDKIDTDDADNQELELQRKKQMAKERAERAMAQMKQQQQSFMDFAGSDFDDSDCEDDTENVDLPEEKKHWRYPDGTCILCQEEMNESHLYGTLALVIESNVLRQTDPGDVDYVFEVVKTPESLDRFAEDIRPFGVAGMNRKVHKQLKTDGHEVEVERQGLGRGYPPDKVKRGTVVTGCSHLMHFSCFEHYYESTRRRHPFQIARNHPESLERKEFVCPLCKALGNAFLPIVWKSKEETLTGVLQPSKNFDEWLTGMGPAMSRLEKAVAGDHSYLAKERAGFFEYGSANIVAPISGQLQVVQSDPYHSDFTPWRTDSGLEDSPLVAPYPVTPRTQPATQLEELMRTYQRLRDTLRSNKVYSAYRTPHAWPVPYSDLTHCDSLVRTLGLSISTIEIAQRGVASQPGFTLLERISPQIITHLRILSETISSYLAVGALSRESTRRTLKQYKNMEDEQFKRLLYGHPQFFNEQTWEEMRHQADIVPLLSSDPFLFLTECSLVSVPSFSWDILHVARLCYIAEIVKAVVVFGKNCDLTDMLHSWERSERLSEIEGLFGYTEAQLKSLQRFAGFFEDSLDAPGRFADITGFKLALFRHLVGAYATPFLRKTVILLHTRYGVVFPPSDFAEARESEQARLCKFLRLPSVDEVLDTCMTSNDEGAYLRAIIMGWCKHASMKNHAVTMSHPAILELVGLPKNYDALVDEAIRRRCPTTGNDMTEPNLCLFCGEIFCGQAICCTVEVGNEEDGPRQLGGANMHMRKSVPPPPLTRSKR